MTLMSPHVDIHLHCPEFEDHETFSAIADALLPEKNWAWRSELNPQRQKENDRQPQRHAEYNACDVENGFPGGNLRRVFRDNARLQNLFMNRSPSSEG